MFDKNQPIQVKWNNATKKHYEELGYKFSKINDTFNILAKELPINSHAKVVVVCDYCGENFYKQYADYNRCHNTINLDACPNCGHLKREDVLELKYGARNPLQVEKFKEKITQTNMDRYGVAWTTLSDVVINKSKQTCLRKYGVDNVFKSKVFQDKAKQSVQEKYGVDNVFKSKEIQENIRQQYYCNGTVPTSKLELQVYELLKSIYGEDNCIHSYPLSTINMDCMLNIGGIYIDVEYDGWYWHKDKQDKDRRRDEFVKSQGYKVLRIKGSHQIPTKEQLINAIDYLVKGNHSYAEIILDIT